MSIPDNVLQRTLTSTSDLSQTSLATKILISRLRREIATNPGALATAMAELRAFFAKNVFAQKDLATL